MKFTDKETAMIFRALLLIQEPINEALDVSVAIAGISDTMKIDNFHKIEKAV